MVKNLGKSLWMVKTVMGRFGLQMPYNPKVNRNLQILNPKLHLNAASCLKCSQGASDVRYCVFGLRFQVYFCQKVRMLVFILSSKNIFNWPSLCSDIPCRIKRWMILWWVPIQHLTNFFYLIFLLYHFFPPNFPIKHTQDILLLLS